MPTDVREKPQLGHDDVLRLNFINPRARYHFRRHYRVGLRSHIMEVLSPEDLDHETNGVLGKGVRWFPKATPLKMLRIFRTRFNASLVEKNQREIYNKYIKADYQYFINHKQGELIYIAATAPQQLSTLMSGVTEFLSQIILSVSVLILLFSLSWQGALAILVLGLAYQFVARYLGKKVSYYSGRGEMEALQDSNVILNETISGIKQVKTFAIGESWINRFSDTIRKRWHHSIRRSVWQQLPPLVLLLILYLVVGTIALVIKLVVPGDFMELIPVFGAFTFAVFRLVPFISTIGNTMMGIMASLPG